MVEILRRLLQSFIDYRDYDNKTSIDNLLDHALQEIELGAKHEQKIPEMFMATMMRSFEQCRHEIELAFDMSNNFKIRIRLVKHSLGNVRRSLVMHLSELERYQNFSPRI